jgi:hypothetical protein
MSVNLELPAAILYAAEGRTGYTAKIENQSTNKHNYAMSEEISC